MGELASRNQRSITGFLTVGLVLAVGYAIGCGSSGSDDSTAFANGTTVVRHITTAPASTESSSGVLLASIFNTTYTPPDPNDVVLRVSIRGSYTTMDTSIVLNLSVRNGAGDLVYFTEGVTLPVGTDRELLLSSSFNTVNLFAGAGVPDGVYQISVGISNGDPGGSSIDLGAAQLEVITMSGVTTMNPSPAL